MSKIIVVKFTEHCSLPGFNIYRPGDVAGFNPEDAALMLEGTKVERNGKSVKVGPWAKKHSETTTEKVNENARKVAETERIAAAEAKAKRAQEDLAEVKGDEPETKTKPKTETKESKSDDKKSDDKKSDDSESSKK